MTETINLDDELFETGELQNFDLDLILPKSQLKFPEQDRSVAEAEILLDLESSGVDLVNHDLKSISKIFEN